MCSFAPFPNFQYEMQTLLTRFSYAGSFACASVVPDSLTSSLSAAVAAAAASMADCASIAFSACSTGP